MFCTHDVGMKGLTSAPPGVLSQRSHAEWTETMGSTMKAIYLPFATPAKPAPIRSKIDMFMIFFFVARSIVSERSSPLSLKVIFEQVKRGGEMGLQKCLDDEFSVNMHLSGSADFEMAMEARECGRAPAWQCGSLEKISRDQVAAVFEPVRRRK